MLLHQQTINTNKRSVTFSSIDMITLKLKITEKKLRKKFEYTMFTIVRQLFIRRQTMSTFC